MTLLFLMQANVDVRAHVPVWSDLFAFEITLVVHVGKKCVICLLIEA